MAKSPFPFFAIGGPPRDRGMQYGAQCKATIRKTIEFYRWIFEYESNINWDHCLLKAAEFRTYILDYDIEILEEMEGIAAGAGCSLEEILAINARSELLFLLAAQGKKMRTCCTAIAATPEATVEQETFLAQNWDWYASTRKQCVILKIEQPGRPDILQLVEAGLLAKTGMNSAGIGLCTNALVCDKWRIGVPFHIILRGILNANSMAGAIGAVTKAYRASAGNYLIGHAEGEVLNIEAGPENFNFIYPQDGLISHANHFQVHNPNITDYIPALWPDSIVRGLRASRMLAADRKRISRESIQSLLQDHFDRPFSICAHRPGARSKKYEDQTNASVILNLSRRQFYVAVGPPCEHEYVLIER